MEGTKIQEEDTEMERYREYIEIFRNLEKKRYWGKKNIEKYYLILLKKYKSLVETRKKEKKRLNWESSTG